MAKKNEKSPKNYGRWDNTNVVVVKPAPNKKKVKKGK